MDTKDFVEKKGQRNPPAWRSFGYLNSDKEAEQHVSMNVTPQFFFFLPSEAVSLFKGHTMQDYTFPYNFSSAILYNRK